MSFFGTISGASATNGGNNIKDGDYRFAIEKVHRYVNHQRQEFFIAELRVLSATKQSGLVDLHGASVNVEPNGVGSKTSMACNLTKHESAKGNAKAFLVAALGALGYAEEDITPEEVEKVCGPSNPLRGVTIDCSTFRKPTKARDKMLTLNSWQTVVQTEAEIIEMRKQLDKRGAAEKLAEAGEPEPVKPAATPTAAPASKAGSLLSRLG